MIYSLKGKVAAITKSSVAIDLGPIAYEVLISRIDGFSLGEEAKVYTYEVLTQDDHYLVGFLSKEEKDAFLTLISVKGIGPKTALGALGAASPSELYAAIEGNNTSFLKKLPGIGQKAAAQIILDLKGKLVKEEEKKKEAKHSPSYEEAEAALKSLGFKKSEIEPVLSSLDGQGLDTSSLIKAALKGLKK